MPVERLSHPSDGTSAKLCALSDFEFRVWHQCRLSANDYGVMLNSPTPLMAENRALERRKAGPVRRALDRIIAVGLLEAFEHQGDGFVCSPRWQDFQRIRYPRASHLPLPTGAALEACTPKTRALFAARPREDCGNLSEKHQEESRDVSEPRAHGPAGNANANAPAIALASSEGERERGPALALVHPPLELSPGQLQAAVPGLVGAWNNIAACSPPFVEATFRSHPKATVALRAHPDIDWWSGLFRRVVASDFLAGRQPMRDGRTFVADVLWCLDHAEEIAAGRYDNRAPAAPVDPNAASVAAAKLAVRRLMP